jgi:hypothetical protein
MPFLAGFFEKHPKKPFYLAKSGLFVLEVCGIKGVLILSTAETRKTALIAGEGPKSGPFDPLPRNAPGCQGSRERPQAPMAEKGPREAEQGQGSRERDASAIGRPCVSTPHDFDTAPHSALLSRT